MKPTLAVIAGTLLALVAVDAHAHGRHRPPRRSYGGPPVETYTAFKLGGLGMDAASATPLDDHGDWGIFLGAEWGITPVPNLDLGLTMDWFHREDERGAVLFVDDPYALPVEIVAADGTTTDLLPLGAVVRAKFPVGSGQFAPFLAGHLGWDLLRLSFRSVETDGSSAVLYEDTEWFHGMSAGISTGVEAALGPGVGVLFEVGLHQSEPHQDLEIDGVPVRARVDADGEFMRAGVRLAF